MGVSKNEFRGYVYNEIRKMKQDYIELTSGDIHREIGGYPDKNHNMPSCCDAMRELMIEGDTVVQEPEKGKGASLTIRYFKR